MDTVQIDDKESRIEIAKIKQEEIFLCFLANLDVCDTRLWLGRQQFLFKESCYTNK